jgi:hypothetical protein
MTLQQAPHRLLDLLHVAHTQKLIQHYTLKHSVWSGDYYPKTMIHIQLLSDSSTAKIDELCRHIETHYTVHIWNRDYTHKTITLAFTNVDQYAG